MSRIVFTERVATEHLWMLYYDLPKSAPIIRSLQLPIILVFLLNAVSFIPLGQLVAARLQVFRERSSALWGYAWNIAGSLLGVVGFTIASLLHAFPAAWFVIFLICGAAFFVKNWRRFVIYGITSGLIFIMVSAYEGNEYYSPYYALRVDRHEDGSISVLTNSSLHQHGLKLHESETDEGGMLELIREGYHLPYRLLNSPPGKVLVLGAGTGNDVAVLLDEGAEQIDAVEIDPAIIEIGREMQPGRVYDSPKVRVINTDARSYLNNTREEYDIITFGTLDSMTRLSALSGVRLDSFVYTLECLRGARKLLNRERGGIIIYFMVAPGYIHYRIVGMLAEAFGRAPFVVRKNYGLFNVIYMAGPAFDHLAEGGENAAEIVTRGKIIPSLEFPSDDWPYLYLASRGISRFYLELMGIFVVIAVTGVLLVSRKMRKSITSFGRIDLEMFLFGLAFLLLETRSVTEMNLIWGATWLTSAVVFSAILIMILLATILTRLKPIPLSVSALALVGTLVLVYLFPVNYLLEFEFWPRLLASIMIIGSPIFFASVCFAHRFKTRADVRTAFGWNLLGAVAGGLLEFMAMVVGFKALLIFAGGAYIVAFSLMIGKRKKTEKMLPVA
jgi:SAM-dependent methyltransferase